MALRELQAMQVAYELLSPLEPSAQQRVLAWLSAALADTDRIAEATGEPAAPVKPVADVPAGTASATNVAEATPEHAAAVPNAQTATPATPAGVRGAAAERQVADEPERKPVAEPAPTPRPKRGRPAKTIDQPAAKAAKSTVALMSAPGRRGERPSGEQFLADLTAVGSFKGLAEKYGKSTGTIANWANQLREQGFDIPVGRQKRA